MTIAINKPQNMHCYPMYSYSEADEYVQTGRQKWNKSKAVIPVDVETRVQLYKQPLEDFPSMYTLLPETFPNRKPMLTLTLPLAPTASGLVLLTQYPDFQKMFTSVKSPLSRVYEVQLEDRLTGLEKEMFGMLRGEVKPSVKKIVDAPKFEIIDEGLRLVRITLTDYKPDNIEQMLLSIRHVPTRVTRTAIGNLTLEDLQLEEGAFQEMEQEHIDKILDYKRELLRRRKVLEAPHVEKKLQEKKKREEMIDKFDEEMFDKLMENAMIEEERSVDIELYGSTDIPEPSWTEEELAIGQVLEQQAVELGIDKEMEKLYEDTDEEPSIDITDKQWKRAELDAQNPNMSRKEITAARKREEDLKRKLLANPITKPVATTSVLIGPRGAVDSRLKELFENDRNPNQKRIVIPKKK
jgi:16S rRNA U516 pseudouridylate synthase RsuA-like enzyme